MYSAISSFKSYIEAREIRSYMFLFLAMALLSSSIASAQGVIFTSLTLTIFCISMFVPFMGKQFTVYPVLLNHQVFYIVPLLVSASLYLKYDFLDHILQLVALGCSTILCSSEIAKQNLDSEFSQKMWVQVVLSIVALAVVSYFLKVMPELTKLVNLFIIASIYFLLDAPVKRVLQFRKAAPVNQVKIFAFSLGIAAVYAYISFSGTSHFLAYLAYIVLAVNLGFCFRSEKTKFFVFSAMILLASLIPFGPVEKYIDNVVLTCAVMLFHLKSPILHYKKTKYGEVKVEYNYYNNKISLVNDSIIQGEKVVGVDNRKEDLRYFGNASKNSVIASIFNLYNEGDSRIAVLGLGAGAMAMLGGKENIIDFYEINPEVVKVAYDRSLFNYLSESESTTSVVMGDAREGISKAGEKSYGLIVVDVYFGSDVPNHFFTKEAIEMYMDKLQDKGILVFHVTHSDHEDFEDKLFKIVGTIGLEGMVAYERYSEGNKREEDTGLIVVPEDNSFMSKASKYCSMILNRKNPDDLQDEVYGWVVVAKKKDILKRLMEDKRWFALRSHDNDDGVYTDESIGYNQRKGEITQEVE